MAITCSVCQQQLPIEIDKKNIFKDSLVIKSNFEKTEEKFTPDEKIRLYLAIELIIGQKVSKSKGSPTNLCNQCFRKLEEYVNFRAQIITSFGTSALSEQNSCHSSQQTFSNDKKEKQAEFFKENDLNDFIETSDCPKLPDNQLVSDDLINVDENSESLDFTTILNNDENTNDFTNCNKLKTDQRNNNLNDSDSSNDNIDVCADSPARILNNDIESDIDVCSGDDDEILEIENTKHKNENVKESENSSDSEIEVCDYEPIGKRTRNFSAIYSTVNI